MKERKTLKDRWIDRQIDRQIDRYIDRQIDRQKDRLTHICTYIPINQIIIIAHLEMKYNELKRYLAYVAITELTI